jgi:hypothetical protein
VLQEENQESESQTEEVPIPDLEPDSTWIETNISVGAISLAIRTSHKSWKATIIQSSK